MSLKGMCYFTCRYQPLVRRTCAKLNGIFTCDMRTACALQNAPCEANKKMKRCTELMFRIRKTYGVAASALPATPACNSKFSVCVSKSVSSFAAGACCIYFMFLITEKVRCSPQSPGKRLCRTVSAVLPRVRQFLQLRTICDRVVPVCGLADCCATHGSGCTALERYNRARAERRLNAA
jgi:hypothetical protein